jgi:hypothetical protein
LSKELNKLQKQFIIQGYKNTHILDERICGFGKLKANSLVTRKNSVGIYLNARKPTRLLQEKEESIRISFKAVFAIR